MKTPVPIRPAVAFVLVTDTGWPYPPSARTRATDVREWADKNWHGEGGYECAKKQGWRVRRVLMVDPFATISHRGTDVGK